MKIGPTVYHQGELMAPLTHEVNSTSSVPNAKPTIDSGYYHRSKIEGASAAELERRLDVFRRTVVQTPGFMPIATREYEVNMGGFYRTGVDVVYVIKSKQPDKTRNSDVARFGR